MLRPPGGEVREVVTLRLAQHCINQTGSGWRGKGSTEDQFVGAFEMLPARRSEVAAMIRTAITLPAALTRIGTV